MGQAANTGRRAELDDRKRRAAGRLNDRSPEIEQIREFELPEQVRGTTGGAFGREGMSSRQGDIQTTSRRGGAGAKPQDQDTDLPKAPVPEPPADGGPGLTAQP